MNIEFAIFDVPIPLAGSVLIYFAYCLCLQAIADKLDTPYGWMAWVPIVQFFLLIPILAGQKWTVLFFAFFMAPLAAFGFAKLGIFSLFLVFLLIPAAYWVFLFGAVAHRRQLSFWVGIACLVPGFGLIPFAYIAFYDGFGMRPAWPLVILNVGLFILLPLIPTPAVEAPDFTKKAVEAFRQTVKENDGLSIDEDFVKDFAKNAKPLFSGLNKLVEKPVEDQGTSKQLLPDFSRTLYERKTCPPSLEERGARPPDGDEAWCVTPKEPNAKHGDYWRWHPDASLHTFGSHIHDKRHGIWLRWFSNGKKEAVAEYEKGIQVGEYKVWAEDGTLQQTVQFKDGKAFAQ